MTEEPSCPIDKQLVKEGYASWDKYRGRPYLLKNTYFTKRNELIRKQNGDS